MVARVGLRRSGVRRCSGRGRAVRCAAVAAVVALRLVLLPATGAHALGVTDDPSGGRGLEAALLAAVRDAHFEQVLDFGPVEALCPGASTCPSSPGQAREVPNVDVAVIEFDEEGVVRRAADVLSSCDDPSGVVAPVDVAGGPAGSYGVSAVRWRGWDIERFDGGTFDPTTGTQLTTKGWHDQPERTDVDDIVAGREGVPLEFMAPYPASLFKLVVAFRIMRLVDEGVVHLDQDVSWDPTPAAAPVFLELVMELHAGELPTPGGSATASAAPGDDGHNSAPARRHDAAAAGLARRHDHPLRQRLGPVPAEAAVGSRRPSRHACRTAGPGPRQPADQRHRSRHGRGWLPGQIHMTAMDTARLLWLIDGGSGTLWTRPDGTPVPSSILSDELTCRAGEAAR